MIRRLALALVLALGGCSFDEEPPPGPGDQQCRSAVCNARGVCQCQGWAVPGPDAGPDA